MKKIFRRLVLSGRPLFLCLPPLHRRSRVFASPGWVRGPGRHRGGAPAMCERPLMSALILRFLPIKGKEQ